MSTPPPPPPPTYGPPTYGPPAPGAPAYGPPAPGAPAFGQPAAGQIPPQQAFGQPAAPFGYGPVCRFCGAVPAVEATVRGHQGFLVMMKFLKLEGPFCRTCGVAAHREMTAKSLWQGWWGIGSMLINPITMLINLPNRAKINKLPEPVPGAPGQPMNPGKPLFQRIAVLGFLIPALVVGAIVLAAQADPDFADAGDCLHNSGTFSRPDVSVVDCSSKDADYELLGKISGTTDSDRCDVYPGTTSVYVKEKGSTRYLFCMKRHKG
ncbi:hypothetical protein OG871_19765 [Kitasatospora sp. NBC_00374]|uniref:LppU/SCO3897 family protein n=1 Tax=Kitasatospora sp. NBC_00374 TaxID=2975964 RepID=UPI0030E03A5A